MRISDWISDVCSSDLRAICWLISLSSTSSTRAPRSRGQVASASASGRLVVRDPDPWSSASAMPSTRLETLTGLNSTLWIPASRAFSTTSARSEEHTSELQSLMAISYADFCLQKKTNISCPVHQHQPSKSFRAENQDNPRSRDREG